MTEPVRYRLRWGGVCKYVRDSQRVTRVYRLELQAGRLNWRHIVTSFAWWVGNDGE